MQSFIEKIEDFFDENTKKTVITLTNGEVLEINENAILLNDDMKQYEQSSQKFGLVDEDFYYLKRKEFR